MAKHSLKFQYNWNNKLFNNVFTTIRFDKYDMQPGMQVDIYCVVKGIPKLFTTCVIVSIEQFEYSDIKHFWKVDTGYSNDADIEKLFFGFSKNNPDFKKLSYYLFTLEKLNKVAVSWPKSVLL